MEKNNPEKHIVTSPTEELYKQENREGFYKTLFSLSRVAILYEDLSGVFEALDELGFTSMDEIQRYFDEEPERVFKILARAAIMNVNPATLDLFEADSKEELLGSLDRILPPEAFPFLRDELISIAMGKFPFEGETVNRSLKGKTLYLWVTMVPIEDETPGKNFLINLVNISDRHERDLEKASAMAKIQEQRIFAETMQEITLAFSTQTRKQSLLDTILQQLQRITEFNTACILVSLGDSLVVERCFGHRDPLIRKYLKNLRLKIDEFPLIEEIIRTKHPRVIKNIEEESGWVRTPHCDYIKSLIQLPLFIGQQFYGILSIEHYQSGFFHDEDIYKLVPFAQIAAIAIGKIELIERLSRELDEKHRTRQELALSLQQKETLLREIHHRVKNNLTLINSLINLQGNQSDNPELQGILNNLRARILSILTVHEKLYRSSDIEHIDLEEYICALLESLTQTVGGDEPIFVINRLEKGIILDNTSLIPLGLILTELFTNSVKYAHPFSGESLEFTVEAILSHEGNEDAITILTRDNGPGLSETYDIDSFESLGLTLVDNLAAQLDGRAEITDPSHAEFRITFPLRQN